MRRPSPAVKLTIAAVTAAVTVTAAVVVVTQDRTTTIKKITGSSDAAPGLAWSIDVDDVGLEGSVFVSPRTGSIFPYGADAIRVGDVAMTLAVVSDDLTASAAEMVGIDTIDGTILWTTPAEDLASCADEPLGGLLVCHQPIYGQTPGYVTFDPATGDSRRYPTEIDLFAVTVANDRLYTTSGNLEDDDVALHRGTLEDPDADWTQPLHADAGWEDDYITALQVGENIGTFDVGGDFSTFDAATGAQLWSTDLLEDCVLADQRTTGDIAVASTFDCEGSSSVVTGSIAYRRDGTVLARSSAPVVQRPSIDRPTDTSIPFVLGDTALDRETGEELWRDDDLAYAYPGDEWNEPRTIGTLQSVIGHVGLTQAGSATIALDLRTGEQIWRGELSGSSIGTDGTVLLRSDGTELTAVDVATGATAWTAEWAMMFPGGDTGSVDVLVDSGDGHYLLQSGSTMAMLAPLP